MVRVAVVALALCACSFEHGSLGDNVGSGGDDGGSNVGGDLTPWLGGGYRVRKPITLAPPNTASLADFPVGILLASDAQLAENGVSDGLDIAFTTSDGTTRLDHELVSYDSSSGALEAWVRIPMLEPGSTKIYMYYGGPQQPAADASTWPTRFAGVWHMGSVASDSTSHSHTAAGASPGTTPATMDGVAGSARDFDGVDDALAVPDPADASLDFGTSSFSFTLWVRIHQSKGAFDAAMYKGGASVSDPGYCVLLGTAEWNMKTHDGTVYRDPEAGTEVLDQWVYLAGVVDRSAGQMLAYRDGVLTNMLALGTYGTLSNAKPLTLGNVGTLEFRGRIDEVRISAGALTPDWIATEYANLASPGFATPGAQQYDGQGGI